jgi:hypothetical protein
MTKGLIIAALFGLIAGATGCGGSSPTMPGSVASANGTWTGTAVDSSTAPLGAGGMMGQAAMGTMTWQLTQNGSNVTGSMSFSGMPNMMLGTLSGTLTAEEMTFTMDLPVGSMMSGTCSVEASGTAHMNPGTMTMTGSYSGMHSCAGAFNNGQITMTRR